jgi:general secretion pathway protein G
MSTTHSETPQKIITAQKDGEPDKEAGFTLVEVMVTLVIIGLLTTFVVMNVLPVQDRALRQKAQGDIKQFELALEQYRLDMFDYPEQSVGLQALTTRPSGADEARYRPGGYIKVLEKDPWGNEYGYRYPGEYGVVDIFSYGSDGEPGGEDNAADITNWER